jgi:hypothetical protein
VPDEGDVQGDESTGEESPAGDVAGRQVAAAQGGRVRVAHADGGLPFTGYVAIPLLLVGAGLLVTGVMIRRRISGSQI